VFGNVGASGNALRGRFPQRELFRVTDYPISAAAEQRHRRVAKAMRKRLHMATLVSTSVAKTHADSPTFETATLI